MSRCNSLSFWTCALATATLLALPKPGFGSEEPLVTRVYDVRDLVRPHGEVTDKEAAKNLDVLMALVTSTVRPCGWVDGGGSGTIAAFRDTLVVGQDPEVHQEVEWLLKQVRTARKLMTDWDGKTPPPVVVPPVAGPDAAEAAIRKALATKVTPGFADMPLEDVVTRLSDKCNVEIQIDDRALEDVGLSRKEKVTLNLHGSISIRATLRHLLRTVDLTYVIRDDVLMITTPEDAESELITRFYPVFDLPKLAGGLWWPKGRNSSASDNVPSDICLPPQFGGPGGGGFFQLPEDDEKEQWKELGDALAKRPATYKWLISLITSQARPESWIDGGGSGAIDWLPIAGALVIAQTDDVHDEIEALLQAYRELLRRDAAAAAGKPLTEPIFPMLESVKADHALRKTIGKKRTGRHEFREIPLPDVMDFLSRKYEVPILIDDWALENEGIALDTTITGSVAEVRLPTALRQILRQLDLTWVIRHEVIVITRPFERDCPFRTAFYPIRDLVSPDRGEPKEQLRKHAEQLCEAMMATVAPESWIENNGYGSIAALPHPPALVVSQSDDAHAQIAALLAALRKVRPK